MKAIKIRWRHRRGGGSTLIWRLAKQCKQPGHGIIQIKRAINRCRVREPPGSHDIGKRLAAAVSIGPAHYKKPARALPQIQEICKLRQRPLVPRTRWFTVTKIWKKTRSVSRVGLRSRFGGSGDGIWNAIQGHIRIGSQGCAEEKVETGGARISIKF